MREYVFKLARKPEFKRSGVTETRTFGTVAINEEAARVRMREFFGTTLYDETSVETREVGDGEHPAWLKDDR